MKVKAIRSQLLVGFLVFIGVMEQFDIQFFFQKEGPVYLTNHDYDRV